MPDVYAPGVFVPELQGAVRGALSVVCHSPFDLECLYAIADLAPRPPGSPLGSLAGALSQSSIDWRGWWAHWRAQGRLIPLPDESVGPVGTQTDAKSERESERESEPDSDLETLKRVLAALFHIWQAQDDDMSYLSCCVSVATEGVLSGSAVVWSGRAAALAFGDGSLWGDIGTASWTARGFIAGLVLGGGIDAPSRSVGLVRRARDAASARLTARGVAPQAVLRDIRTMAPADLKANERLCVLVHGLCSTDVGTFDGFEAQIRKRSGMAGNARLSIVGFPHDSLTTPIDTNAKELAQELVRLNARECRLVCHSRGGLVARRAAAWLRREPAEASPARGRAVAPPSWIHSCVTFGTPHLGTSAASAPRRLTALLMSLAHLSRSPGAQSVVDILCGVRAGETYVGVSELGPKSVDGSCLGPLEQMEDCLFLNDRLPLHVIGSVGPFGRSLKAWLITRILGTGEHDLLVPITSSVPPLRPGNAASARVYGRTHFEYFSRIRNEMVDPPFWNTALSAMGLPSA